MGQGCAPLLAEEEMTPPWPPRSFSMELSLSSVCIPTNIKVWDGGVINSLYNGVCFFTCRRDEWLTQGRVYFMVSGQGSSGKPCITFWQVIQRLLVNAWMHAATVWCSSSTMRGPLKPGRCLPLLSYRNVFLHSGARHRHRTYVIRLDTFWRFGLRSMRLIWFAAQDDTTNPLRFCASPTQHPYWLIMDRYIIN